jgi:hypothetical protein
MGDNAPGTKPSGGGGANAGGGGGSKAPGGGSKSSGPQSNAGPPGTPDGNDPQQFREDLQKWSTTARENLVLIEQVTNEERTDEEKNEIIGAMATSIVDDINSMFFDRYPSLKQSLEFKLLAKLQNELSAVLSDVAPARSAGGGSASA